MKNRQFTNLRKNVIIIVTDGHNNINCIKEDITYGTFYITQRFVSWKRSIGSS